MPDGSKDSPGGPWEMVGVMPMFDPPRHDSAETIREALNLGVHVKMITGQCSPHPGAIALLWIAWGTHHSSALHGWESGPHAC